MGNNRTRRPNGTGSLRKLPSGSWHGRIRLPGTDIRYTITGRTKSEVQLKLLEAVALVERGQAPQNDHLTVGAWIDRWLDEIVRPHKEPATYETYDKYVRLYLDPLLGNKKLARLSAADVQRMVNELKRRGLSGQTIVHARAVLRQALNAAMRWDIVDRNVATLVELPTPEPHNVRPLTAEDARKVLAAVKGTRLEVMVLVAMALGLRQEEVLGLTWEAVDFGREEIRIERVLVRSREKREPDGKRLFELRAPKTRKSRRTIPLPAPVVEALRKHRDLAFGDGVGLDNTKRNEWGLVFPSARGAPIDGSDVTHRFQKALVRAGLPHMRFHDLRHGAASFLVAMGVSLPVAMAILGHAHASTLLNVYARANHDEKRAAMEALGRVLVGDPTAAPSGQASTPRRRVQRPRSMGTRSCSPRRKGGK